MIAERYRIFFWDDENILGLDSGGLCNTVTVFWILTVVMSTL